MVNDPVPDGYHNVNPFIFVDGAEGLVGFLVETFAAEETERITRPDGRIGHAEVRIGDSIVMVSDASEMFPARPCAHYLFVEDVSASYQRALTTGATSLREPTDQFYGNREAGVVDAFDNIWWLATVIEEVAPDELQRRWQQSTP